MEQQNSRISELMPKILKQWYWFVISVIIFLFGSWLYMRIQTPIFKTMTKVFINKDSGNGGGGAQLEQLGLINTSSSIETEIVFFSTYSLMQKVVKDLNANITYYQEGKLKAVELYEPPFLLTIVKESDNMANKSYQIEVDNSNIHFYHDDDKVQTVKYNQLFKVNGLGQVKVERNPKNTSATANGMYLVSYTSIASKAAALEGNLSVLLTNPKVNILDISFKSALPRKSVEVLNSLIENYVKENIADKNRVADSTIKFIEDRLIYVGQELGSVEGEIQKFKQSRKIADIPTQSQQLIANSGISIDELSKVETQLSIVSTLEKYLNDESQTKRIFPGSSLLNDPSFGALVDKYNMVVMDRERQLLTSTVNNPYIINLDQQLLGLRSDMISSLQGTKRALNVTKVQLNKRSNQIESGIVSVPKTERSFLDLSRQQQIKQELYLFLMQKREETAISKTTNVSNLKIIEAPMTGGGPISPNKNMILLIGAVLGLLLPLVIIYLKDVLNTTILTQEDITSRTQTPIVGAIGNSNNIEGAIVVSDNSRSAVAEQFRGLRTNLSFVLGSTEKVVLITSSMSGEGKSFIALNLATILAISGKKVLAMEMDLRKPNLSNKLDLKSTAGFTSLIIDDKLEIDSIIQPSGLNDNMFIISSGPLPPNPTELILNPKVSVMMEKLKGRFDYIIIDAPPIGLVTDAQLLSAYSDTALYVVRQGYTDKKQLAIAQDIYSNSRMKKLNIVINDVSADAGGYGYGYGYGYGSYGNDDDTTSDSFIKKVIDKLKSRK